MKGLNTSASLIALLISAGATPAHAQDAAPAPSAPASGAEQPSTAPDIIVTGLRRNESFINAPVAVQVFNDALIKSANITRPQDFLRLTPNVTFITSNHAGEFFVNIRGQTSVRQSESAVAVVIDGVQLSTQNEFNGELVDIDQIEVLKGPQGAYYGRNAAAGAIIIRTKKPTDTFEGQATASYGNFDSYKANVSFGGAIVPGSLRFRASASATGTNGSYTNIVTGEHPQRFAEKIGRLRLNYDNGGPLQLDFVLTGSRGKGGATAFNAQVTGSVVGGVPVNGISTQNTGIPYVSDVPGDNSQYKSSASLKADYDLGFATLTSVTSYSMITDRYQAKNFPYADFSDPRNQFGVFAVVFGDLTQRYRIANRAFTQELRLTSPGDGMFQWQVGAYYLKAHRRFTSEQGLNGRPVLNPDGTVSAPVILNPDGTVTDTLQGGGHILPTDGIDGINSTNPTNFFDDNRYTFENYAPFGNVQISPTDRIDIRLAGRYDVEKRTIRTLTPDIANPVGSPSNGYQPISTYNLCVLFTGQAASACHSSATFKQFEPKATITYKFPGLGSVYGSWGRSFKSGGFNPIGTRAQLLAASPGANPADIFVQDTYKKEVGTSYEVGFKSQFFNHRLSFNGAVFHTDVKNAQQFEFFPTAGIQAVSSIDKVRIRGFEFDANARVTDWLMLFAGYGYVDSKIRKLAASPQYEGNRTPYSAKDNVNAGFQLDQRLSEAVKLTARMDYTHTGSIWYDASNLPGSKRVPVDLVDARVALVRDRWEVAMLAKNLFDKKYNADDVPLLSIIQATFKAPRRTWAVEARVRF